VFPFYVRDSLQGDTYGLGFSGKKKKKKHKNKKKKKKQKKKNTTYQVSRCLSLHAGYTLLQSSSASTPAGMNLKRRAQRDGDPDHQFPCVLSDLPETRGP